MCQKYTYRGVFVIISVICALNVILCENPSQFCDHDYIDAVLWNGLTYRVTRHQWIATYNEKTKTVENFVHKNYLNLKDNEFYQSVYYIPRVPDCRDKSSENCFNMTRLKGLSISLLRNSQTNKHYYQVRSESGGQLPYGLKKLSKEMPFHKLDSSRFWPYNFNQWTHKYKPAVYSPENYLFLYIKIENNSTHSNVLFVVNQLSENGLQDGKWDAFTAVSSKYTYITAFWWKFQNKLYLVREPLNRPRKGIVRGLKYENQNFVFDHKGITVKAFFGCDKRVLGTTKATSTSIIEQSSQSFWIIIIVVVVIGLLALFAFIFILIYEKYYSGESLEDIKTSKRKRQITNLKRMLKKMPNKVEESGSQMEESPSFQTLGFETRSAPIGSLKDPIPIEKS